MRRVIGLDIHRTFAEAVAWEDGRLLRLGRLDMTRTALEGFGKSLRPSDEVVVEATGNAMAVVRVLSPFVARVIVANPLQVKAIAHAHVRQTRSTPAFWRACTRPASCRRSGPRTRRRSVSAVWLRGGTKSSGTAPGSRTRYIQSCTRT